MLVLFVCKFLVGIPEPLDDVELVIRSKGITAISNEQDTLITSLATNYATKVASKINL